MKIVRIKYLVPLGPMMEDLQRVFPNITVNATTLRERGGMLAYREKKRFAYVKEYFDLAGIRIHCIVIALVRDSFAPPSWLQGLLLLDDNLSNPVDHYFMGHEVPVPDSEDTPPDSEI